MRTAVHSNRLAILPAELIRGWSTGVRWNRISRSGGFDELNSNRAQVVNGVEAILAMASRTSTEAEIGQSDFFGGGNTGVEELPLQMVEPWLPMDQLGRGI